MNQVSKLDWPHKILFVLKMAIGSGLAWQLAHWTGSKYPYLAPISVILCLQATMLKSVRFGIARVLGTILGVVVTLVLVPYLPQNGWSIAFVLLICSGISLIFGANVTSLHQIGLSSLLVLVFEEKLHGYGFDRIIDSIIGVFVALIIHAFIVPPNFTSASTKSIQKLTQQLVSKLESLSVWIENGTPIKNYFEADMNHNVWTQLQQTAQQLSKSESSLRYNPFSKSSKKELNDNKQKLNVLRKEFAIVESFYEIIQQWIQAQPMTKQDIELWARTFRQLAKSLQSFHPVQNPEFSYTNEGNIPYHNLLTFEANRFLHILK